MPQQTTPPSPFTARPLETITAAELSQKELPEQRWAIVGLLPEGASLLVGPPKIGKSWMVLQLAISVARGKFDFLGESIEESGEVLYLALEDSERRMKGRLEMMAEDPQPENLHLLFEFRRFDSGGLTELDGWLTDHPQCRLVLIDTLARVRPRRKRSADLYQEDTALGASLQHLAKDHQISILVVHHTNKNPNPADPIDTISGTQGLAGSVDSIWILNRRHNQSQGTIFITGRDVEERQIGIEFDSETGLWQATGLAPDAFLSPQRQAIIDCLTTADAPLFPRDIAKNTEQPNGNVRQLLGKLYREEVIEKDEQGRYYIPITGNSSNKSNDDNSDHTGNSGNGS